MKCDLPEPNDPFRYAALFSPVRSASSTVPNAWSNASAIAGVTT